MSPKKKVVRIIARLNIGGPAIHTILLTKWLSSDKFSSILLTGSLSKGEGDMSYLADQYTVHPIFIPEFTREIALKSDICTLWKMLRLLYIEKPDILHTHTAKAGTLGRIAGILYNFKNRLGGKPRCALVHTFHGHVLHSYFNAVKTSIFIFIEKILARFTDAVIVISEEQKKDIGKRFGIIDNHSIHVIPLGFDLTPFFQCEKNNKSVRKELSIDDDSIVVGIVGRLVPIKNHHLFLDVVKRISPLFKKLTFVVVGDGECKNELLSYAETLGIKKRVIFCGWKKNIAAVYDSMDIVALTSRNEGTPVSLIEAMASQKPVIATDVGGVRDIFSFAEGHTSSHNGIQVAENGILITENNTETFSKGLELLISDENLRKQQGNKGRTFVPERFSITRLTKDIEQLYDRL